MMGKKVVLIIKKNLETEQNDCFRHIFLTFLLIKRKKTIKLNSLPT
jgi:hypothetical protein